MTDLAEAAHASVSTVKRFESDASQPVSDDLVGPMRDAAEAEGMCFLPDDGDGQGVKHRQG